MADAQTTPPFYADSTEREGIYTEITRCRKVKASTLRVVSARQSKADRFSPAPENKEPRPARNSLLWD